MAAEEAVDLVLVGRAGLRASPPDLARGVPTPNCLSEPPKPSMGLGGLGSALSDRLAAASPSTSHGDVEVG